MKTVDAPEKEYWKKSSCLTRKENDLFFDWYEQTRVDFFQPMEDLLSLEIGAGTGGFARRAKINVVAELSYEALANIRKDYACLAVVADAANLPFKDGCFSEVYAIDVFHHLKADNLLAPAATEVKRVLRSGGIFNLADRLPSKLNWWLLKAVGLGRSIFVKLSHLIGRNVLLSGSDNEPHLTEADYKVILAGMSVADEKKWMSWVVYVLFGGLQFTGIVLPEQMQLRLGNTLLSICEKMEMIVSDNQKISLCLKLKKD